MNKFAVFGLLLVSLLLLGCTSSSEVKKVEQTATPAATIGETSAPTTESTPAPTPEVKTFKVAEVGESLTDGKLKITLNSAEFMDTIPNENQFLAVKAKDGKTFAVVDVSIENTAKEATVISSIMYFKVKDPVQGYSYTMDFTATMGLSQSIDGKLQPGEKIRGKLAFEVPKDAANLQLIVDFGIVDMAQAKFNLKKA